MSVACGFSSIKIVSEYDQEIPQSQTADNHYSANEVSVVVVFFFFNKISL